MRCLILNTSYDFLNVTHHWSRAVKLLYKDRIKPIVFYDRFINSESTQLRVPAVALTTDYVHVGKRKHSFALATHRNILIREGYRCAYCGCPISINSVTKDHVVPTSRGGKDDLLNVVASCYPCNSRKADRTPQEASMRLRVPLRNLTNDEKLSVLLRNHDDSLERDTWMSFLRDSGISLF